MNGDYWRHDRDARLDYVFDWTSWLGADTITSAVVTAPGLTVEPAVIDGGRVTVWLSAETLGPFRVACRIITAAGRVDERTRTLIVTER